MKKSLIAIAVAASVAPVAAFADATIYGRAHVSVDYFTNEATPDPEFKDLWSASSNASRIGFKGGEDIMHGMKASWQIESEIIMDGGDATVSQNVFAGRNTFVRVGGGFGDITIGKNDTPVKGISRAVDPFNDQAGDSRNVIAAAGKFDERPNNTVTYSSPSIAGAKVDAQYAMGGAGKSLMSAALTYKMDKMLYVGAGYEMHGGAYNGTAGETESAFRVGVSFSAAGATVGGLYQASSNVGNVKDAARNVMGASLSYKLGDDAVKLSYYMAGEREAASGSVANTEGSVWAVGYDHSMSKMTTVYLAAAGSSNGTASTSFSAANQGGHKVGAPSAAGKSTMNVSFGVVHNF